jgi:hypothetical protein
VLAAALLILLALGAPLHADDPIADWLKQDESDGQNDQVRPDLHAVCTENSVLFDCVTESPNVSGDDRSALALPGPVRLAVQVEEPT